MSLHRLNRAPQSQSFSGTMDASFFHFCDTEITINGMGLVLRITNNGGVSPYILQPRQSIISASLMGTTQTATVNLGGAVSNASGSFVMTGNTIDVLSSTGVVYQTWEPGANVNIQVVWHSGVTRLNFNVTAPSSLAALPQLSHAINAGAAFSKAAISDIFSVGCSCTATLASAGQTDLVLGYPRSDVYTINADPPPAATIADRWTAVHTGGASILYEHLGAYIVGGVGANPATGRCFTATTRSSGFDLSGTVFANDAGYPNPIIANAIYYKDPHAYLAPPVLTTTPLTANPTFALSDEQSGYEYDNSARLTQGGSSPPVILLNAGNSGARPNMFLVQVALDDASLNSVGESFTADVPCNIHGWSFDAFTLAHAASLAVDDGSAVDTADGIWQPESETVSNAVVSTSAGILTLNAPSGAAAAVRMWDFQKSKPAHAYRYLRIRFRITAGLTTIPIEIWTMQGNRIVNTPAWVSRKWTLSGVLGTWQERIIDLCSPDAMDFLTFGGGSVNRTAISLPAFDLTDSIYPQWAAVSAPYWGLSFFDRFRFALASGQNVEIDYIQLERETAPTLGMFGGAGDGYFAEAPGASTQVRPALRAHCDEKAALELYDRTIGGSVRTIAQLIAEVGTGFPAASSPSKWEGWTAAAVAYPAWPSDSFLSGSSPATWIGGGGIVYSGGAWSAYKEVAAASVTVPAQALFASFAWYPGAGDVFGFTGGARASKVPIRAAAVLRSLIGGIVYDLSGNPVTGDTVDCVRVDNSESGGSDTTDADGEYFTGTPCMKGGRTYRVRSAAATKLAKTNFRHRGVFRVQPATTGNWVSRDRSAAGVHYRAYVNGGTIQVGNTSDVLAATWQDRSTGTTGTIPQIRVERRAKGQRLRLVYKDGGGAIVEKTSTNEGVSWSVAVTIRSAGDHHDFVVTPGARYYYIRDGSAIKVKAYDDANNVIIAETNAIASGVDSDAISCTENTIKGGARYIHLSYWASGSLIEKRSRDGINFT